jgi:hypothetical protein
MEMPSIEEVPAKKGLELKGKLYQLLIDGDYDFPRPQDYEGWEALDPNDPQHKSIRADYVNDGNVAVHLACAATKELSQNTGIFSRNYIDLLWTDEFDEAGERMIDKSLTVYLDEVSGLIGHVQRDRAPAGKYRQYAQKQLGGTDGADFFRRLLEAARLRSSFSNDQMLDLDEFNRLSRVLAGLEPRHRVSSIHLRR